jgi:hypothetical protein
MLNDGMFNLCLLLDDRSINSFSLIKWEIYKNVKIVRKSLLFWQRRFELRFSKLFGSYNPINLESIAAKYKIKMPVYLNIKEGVREWKSIYYRTLQNKLNFSDPLCVIAVCVETNFTRGMNLTPFITNHIISIDISSELLIKIFDSQKIIHSNESYERYLRKAINLNRIDIVDIILKYYKSNSQLTMANNISISFEIGNPDITNLLLDSNLITNRMHDNIIIRYIYNNDVIAARNLISKGFTQFLKGYVADYRGLILRKCSVEMLLLLLEKNIIRDHDWDISSILHTENVDLFKYYIKMNSKTVIENFPRYTKKTLEGIRNFEIFKYFVGCRSDYSDDKLFIMLKSSCSGNDTDYLNYIIKQRTHTEWAILFKNKSVSSSDILNIAINDENYDTFKILLNWDIIKYPLDTELLNHILHTDKCRWLILNKHTHISYYTSKHALSMCEILINSQKLGKHLKYNSDIVSNEIIFNMIVKSKHFRLTACRNILARNIIRDMGVSVPMKKAFSVLLTDTKVLKTYLTDFNYYIDKIEEEYRENDYIVDNSTKKTVFSESMKNDDTFTSGCIGYFWDSNEPLEIHPEKSFPLEKEYIENSGEIILNNNKIIIEDSDDSFSD